jgi:hypothetical protein
MERAKSRTRGDLLGARRRAWAALAAALLTCAGCGAAGRHADAESSATNGAQPQKASVSARPVPAGRGIRCQITPAVYGATPASYSASDAARRGVPSLTSSQMKTLHTIEWYVHSSTLRFAFADRESVVYDADKGPCIVSAPGYFVLNGACNEYYMPSDPNRTVPLSGGCFEPPRPWVPSDKERSRN